jgi:hypothetical protein
MCARVVYNALKGRNHAKATSFVFQLGREVIEAHGWQDREPPKVIKQKLIEQESKKKVKKEVAIWLDGIDRRPKQYHELFIGEYCLTIMILLGWCRMEWQRFIAIESEPERRESARLLPLLETSPALSCGDCGHRT